MKTPYFINSTNILVGVRFVARGLAVCLILLALFLLYNMFGQKQHMNLTESSNEELILTLSFFCVLLGLLFAFRWEGFGGILTLVGLAVFTFDYYHSTGVILWKILIFGIPAILFVFCWYMTTQSDEYDVYRS
jgi:hypothetical protein